MSRRQPSGRGFDAALQFVRQRREAEEIQKQETAAAEWWRTDGIYIDPDTDEVDWFDKRAELAQIAFLAGYRAAKGKS